jgi:hypothetical protein
MLEKDRLVRKSEGKVGKIRLGGPTHVDGSRRSLLGAPLADTHLDSPGKRGEKNKPW